MELSLGGTCRLCLCTESDPTMIFAQGETSEQLRFRILDCCPVELIEDARLPNAICRDCERKLAATFEFRERCRRSERALRLRYGTCYTAHEPCPVDTVDRAPVWDRNVALGSRGEEKDGHVYEGAPLTKEAANESNGEVPESERGVRLSKNDDHAASKGSAEKGTTGGNAKAARYLCDICSGTFASKSGLRLHLKSHNGVKPHLCRYCGKGFAIPSYVKRHEAIHSADKRFACHFCSATFASPNGLRYHSRAHTGEANYRCDTCGKSFRRRKYLTEHAFTHTGEKPYVCKTCGSSYGNSGSLFVHEKKCKRKTLEILGGNGKR